MRQLRIVREVWQFLKIRKKLWLAPLVMILIALGVSIVLSSGSAIGPFIYALF